MRWSIRGTGLGLVLLMGPLACGDDSGSESTSSNDDSCQSLCGCDGCPQTGGPMTSETEGSGSTSAGSDSASGSTGATTAESSTGSSSTASDETSGPMVCECDPADPDLPACPDQANCSDVSPGDECCTADGQLRVCVQNDIGVVWLNQTDC